MWNRRAAAVPLLLVSLFLTRPTQAFSDDEARQQDSPKTPETSKKEDSTWTDYISDAVILGAKNPRLRYPNDWKVFRGGVNVYFLNKRHWVIEPAISVTALDADPSKALLQPAVGLSLCGLKRILFVGAGYSMNTGLHDNWWFFGGFSGVGIKDYVKSRLKDDTQGSTPSRAVAPTSQQPTTRPDNPPIDAPPSKASQAQPDGDSSVAETATAPPPR